MVTVGDIPYFNTKFFESETYTYGKYIPGNVSMSGELGAEDLTVLRKNILGVNSFDELQKLAADMNNDKEIDIRDLISLKKRSLNKATGLSQVRKSQAATPFCFLFLPFQAIHATNHTNRSVLLLPYARCDCRLCCY